jgi:hypothetical protein
MSCIRAPSSNEQQRQTRASSHTCVLTARALAAVICTLALILTAPLGLPMPAARADGDPASDVLLAQNAFYPYQPPVSSGMETAMNKVLSNAAHVGLSLKVAIIGSPEDLGADPRFFGYPAQYAHYLDREISFNNIQPLLVVMPAGFATVAAGPATALEGLSVDSKQASYGLTRSAVLAVVALVRAHGHPIAMPSIPPDSSTSSGPPAMLLLFGIPAVLLILAGVATLRSGAANEQERLQGPPPL